MKVIVLGGAGIFGQIVSRRLVQSELVSDLVIAGRTLETCVALASSLGPKVSGAEVDVFDEAGLEKFICGAGLIINFTGPEYQTIIPVLRAAIRAGVNYCDVGVDGGVAKVALEMSPDAEAAGMTAMIGIGAIPGLFNMTALHALSCLDEPKAVHFAYCHEFGALIGSPEEHHERIRSGKSVLAVPKMYMHALSGKISQFHDGKLKDVDAYSDPHILPLFSDGAIEVYTFGSSEPITFSRAVPTLKQVTASVGFFPPELNQFFQQEITSAGAGGEEKAFCSIVEGLIGNPERMTDTTREVVGCGEVVCIDGIKDGKKVRCIAEPCWNSGSFDPNAVTVDPLMVAVIKFLQGEINTGGVITPESWFDPQSFFEELAKMTPIVSVQNGSYVRTRIEPLS